MERENLYRGKRVDNGEWAEGSLVMVCDGETLKRYPCIVISYNHDTFDWEEVIPETVGQFTGLTTPNHKTNLSSEVIEDDIFRATKETDDGEDITYYLVVMWIKQLAAFYLIPVEYYYVIRDNDVSNEPEFAWLFDEASLCDFSLDSQLIKVGNIHDNPEFLE